LTARSTPTLGIGSTLIREKDGMTMVYVPVGEFTMGSEKGDRFAKPVHSVALDAYWIDQTELTNGMYAKCVNAGVCDPPIDVSTITRSSYYGNSQFNNYPVIHVNWNQARAYCDWAGVTLPTEAQWEKAARGTDGRVYPWGDEKKDCSKANSSGCESDTAAVGSYPAEVSPYGAFGMAGNVQEWVNDWYDGSYYSNSPSNNPQGPSSGNLRVVRGGAWNLFGEITASTFFRSSEDPKNNWNTSIGFRCVRSAAYP
jgi:serine/threonine-protein kinase